MLIQTLATHPIQYFRIIVIMIFSICFHELAHGVAAISQGDNTPKHTGHMTINPLVHMGWQSLVFLCIGGIAWGAMPVNPSRFRSRWGDVIVSAAGPLSNLFLGVVFIALLAIALRVPFLSAEFFYLAAQVNLALCLFNLLPIPPLDGFHIFSKFFPELKMLEGSQLGLFALMFFLVSGLGTGLYIVSNAMIECLLRASASVI